MIVAQQAGADYDLQAILQVAMALYEAGPPTPFLITPTHMKNGWVLGSAGKGTGNIVSVHYLRIALTPCGNGLFSCPLELRRVL